MTSSFRHFDANCRRLAIDQTAELCDKNDTRQSGYSRSFRCDVRVVQTRVVGGGFWRPSRKRFDPKCQKTFRVLEWCKAVSVSRLTASHWHTPIVTKARFRRLAVARTRAIRDESRLGPCAKTRDETELPVNSVARLRSASTSLRASQPASRGERGPKSLLGRAGARRATGGSLVH